MSHGRVGRAAVLAVGSELLTPSRLDTNSLFITRKLNAIGIEVVFKVVVGDDRDELAHALRQALERVDLTIVTGGLGPTDDDITREVAAKVVGRALEERVEITEAIRRRFKVRGMEMPEINRRQAQVPQDAVVLLNDKGTAPGLWLETGDRLLVLLPGPPRELQPMLERLISDRLASRGSGDVMDHRVVRITGRTESHTETAVRHLYNEWSQGDPPVRATILASLGQIEIHLSAQGARAAHVDRALERACEQLGLVLGGDVYSADGRTLESVVGDLLVARKLRVAVAESCTGGLLSSRLTDVSGSSRYFDRAVVAYSNQAKMELLGVSRAVLDEHGAVSEPVAVAMAAGIRDSSSVDLGIGVTGIAGPGGGSDAKPTGTVAIAVVGADRTDVRTAHFPGEREQVKFQASQAALDMVRRMIG